MTLAKSFDLSAYFILGPENTLGRDPLSIIGQALEGGFRFLQIRSKEASARDLIDLTLATSRLIEEMGLEEEVTLVVNDRLDVVLAARDLGAKVDGIHLGQTDIPVEVCRKYLGLDAIIGLSAPTSHLIDYVKGADVSQIDYFGAGPLHETESKPDCGLDEEGNMVLRTLDELSLLAQLSPIPVVVGGGVKEGDLQDLAGTGVGGFFVISAISHAKDPRQAAQSMVEKWKEGVARR